MRYVLILLLMGIAQSFVNGMEIRHWRQASTVVMVWLMVLVKRVMMVCNVKTEIFACGGLRARMVQSAERVVVMDALPDVKLRSVEIAGGMKVRSATMEIRLMMMGVAMSVRVVVILSAAMESRKVMKNVMMAVRALILPGKHQLAQFMRKSRVVQLLTGVQ